MILTAGERKALRRALCAAIEWEDSLIDAHRVAYDRRNPCLPKVVPAEYRPLAKRCRRRILQYRQLLMKIRGQC